MRIIKTSAIRRFWDKHPEAEHGLQRWLRVALNADWDCLDSTRMAFPHADEVIVKSKNTVTVFNIAGNKYRLIVSIKYRWRIIYIRDFLTHAEYDKDFWKARH